jgi:hypothetical protein
LNSRGRALNIGAPEARGRDQSLEERRKRPPEAPEAYRGLRLWKAKINFPRGATLLEKIEPAKSMVV